MNNILPVVDRSLNSLILRKLLKILEINVNNHLATFQFKLPGPALIILKAYKQISLTTEAR